MNHMIPLESHGLVFLLTAGLWGCITDRPVDETVLGGGLLQGDSNCDGGTCPDVDTSQETSLGQDGYLHGGYGLFFTANANWAPGVVESYPPEGVHEGWEQARCFECHGVGMPNEPADHDPRMQYWPWACARGFPGSSCHGHGVNGTSPFNHDFDKEFDNCTQAGCHDQYNAEKKDFENHGFYDAPDSFCNACHDYYWEEWPVDPLAVSSESSPW
jgi:hypothetical protein